MLIADLTLRKGEVYYEQKSKIAIVVLDIENGIITCRLSPSKSTSEVMARVIPPQFSLELLSRPSILRSGLKLY